MKYRKNDCYLCWS